MALITRVSRLFQADLHAVLDRVEEPDVLLRQAFREMEEALTREERGHRLLAQEHDHLTARQQELEQSLTDLDGQLNLCFESGREDLARALVRRKLEMRRLLKVLSRRHAEVEAKLAGAHSRLQQDRARLEAMRQKVELLGDRQTPRDEAWQTPEVIVREDDVEVAFLQEKNRRARS